jgi:hypothetical protein
LGNDIYIESQEMSKKYYITESQMKRIVSHVKSGSNEQEVIEEGWKEVALGAALLLGATFGGNKAMAQQANDAILRQLLRMMRV